MSSDTTEDGTRFLICTNPFHGEIPRTWEPVGAARLLGRSGGIGAELGIWDKLYESVPAGNDFVPYGDVEDTFAERYPEDMTRLIREYGHVWRDPDYPSTRYSASVYLGARLGELAREGLLEHKTGPAEGKWAYNGTYEWWRKTPTNSTE